MPQDNRIFNVTRGFRLKPGQVERAFLNCAMKWEVEGVSVRDCTIAEAIQLRNDQAKVREPLAYAEIPGLSFKPPASGQESTRRAPYLIREAHELAMRAA